MMSKLNKMSMPGKRKPLDDAAVLELEMEPSSEDSSEGDSGESSEEESSHEGEKSPLADVSDDELLAEIRKRGLSAKAEKASSSEPSSDEEY